MGRDSVLILPVILALFLGSRICYGLKTYEPKKAGLTRNGSVYSSQLLQYQVERKQNKDGPKLSVRHRDRRGVGDELNELKNKAKKANSVYKWIKENWKKIFVIIVAIFALIVVVGIYRRCFSDSDSRGDDVEPNVVVLKMQKPDTKANGEFLDPILREGTAQESDESTKDGKRLGHITHPSETQGCTDKRITDKVENTGEGRNQTSISLAATTDVHVQDMNDIASATSKSFSKDDRFPHFEMDSIPVSGYTTFQQNDFSLLYFDFFKHLLEVKMQAEQLRIQSTMMYQGSTSKGPFPLYEEIPLIKVLVTSLTEKYCKDYVPIADTDTNLPLTVSP